MGQTILFFEAIIVICCLSLTNIFTVANAEGGITVTVLDVMNMTKEEFISNGLGSGTAYTAQRQAIAEGSSFLLTTATTVSNNPSTSNQPTWMSTSSSQSSWRRSGQYIGGGSEAEEEEFFAEADRVYERWLEAQQLRKIQEAREKKNNQKNDDQRASAEASNEENETKKGKNQKDNNGKSQANKDDPKSTGNLPLALPAATLTSQDAKRRKLILNPNITIEQKMKTVAFDVKSVMKRLRSAFLPAASTQYKITTTGKSAANAARHRRFLFENYYNGMLPSALITDPNTGQMTENETLIEEAVGHVIYDMLRTYTSSSSPSSDEKGITATQPSALTGLLSPIISTVSPYAWYPRLHSLPIVDVDELSSLAEELRYLKAAELAIETQFAPIEKGAYPHDLSLKIASLMKSEKTPSDHHYGEGKSTLSMIENSPRDYYRSLRQFTLNPKIGAELNVLSNVINTNYQYQSQLIHSSYPILAMMLPRLRAEVSELKTKMRANDESTTALRKQLKEQNQILKIMNNDIATLNGISMRMNRFRLNGNIGAASSVSSRSLLLSASDVTTLLMWITEERRSGAASSASIHKDDFSRIQRGEQPLGMEGAEEAADDSSASSSSKKQRKSRRSKRGETSDNYLEGDTTEFVRRPISEWAHIVTFTALGLSLFEMLNLVLAIGLLPLLDGLIQTPLLLIRYTRWLLFFVYPSLRRWAGGNRLGGPSPFGKVFLVVCQIHLYCMTLISDFFARFGCIAMPLIGLYYTEVMEAYVLSFLMYIRQFIAGTYTSARGNAPPPHQSFHDIQMTLRQRIPFSVWVLATPLQQATLAVLLVVLGSVVTLMFTAPMYRRARRDLSRILGRKEK